MSGARRARKVERVHISAFTGQAMPKKVRDNDEIFEAVAIGPQSQLDQVYLIEAPVSGAAQGDQTLWAQEAGFNDRFRRDTLIVGDNVHLVSVERPLLAQVRGPLWVADRSWGSRFFGDGDRQNLRNNYAFFSSQIVGALQMFPVGGDGGVPDLRSFGLELELYRECPPFLPTKRPPAVVVNQVNSGEWGGASERVVCAAAAFGRGAAQFSIALDNPGAGTYVVRFYGINWMTNDQDLIESSLFTQLLDEVTYTTDNQFEVYQHLGHFDAYAMAARNSAGADTAKGVFMIQVRDLD